MFFGDQRFSVDSWTTVLSSAALGFSPMPKQGSSLAMASLNLGWDTAYTMGLMQHAVLAKIKSNPLLGKPLTLFCPCYFWYFRDHMCHNCFKFAWTFSQRSKLLCCCFAKSFLILSLMELFQEFKYHNCGTHGPNKVNKSSRHDQTSKARDLRDEGGESGLVS